MQSNEKKVKISILLLIMLVLSVISLFYQSINPFLRRKLCEDFSIVSKRDAMLVHFISIGQGDAIAINLPNGKIMLIDCGLEESNVTLTNYLSSKVFHDKRNNYIDYLVLTHADIDHTGGARKLIKEFELGEIFIPTVAGTTAYYENLMKDITNAKIKVCKSQESVIEQDGYKISFFVEEVGTSTNDCSTVIKLEYCGASFLFAADISAEVENVLASKYSSELACDVLKVAHHGSKYSSSKEFLNVAKPKYAVICCGENDYGLPAEDAINNLKSISASILRTDLDGNICFVVGNDYNLNYLIGNYFITSLNIDIRLLFLIIDIVIALNVLIIVFKRDKKRK